MRPPAYDPKKRDSKELQGKSGATKSELEALQALVTALESQNMEMMTSIDGLKED